MRRMWGVIVLVTALAAAACSGTPASGGSTLALPWSRATPEPDYETIAVVRGDISAVVSATGIVQAEREASLFFQTTGTIAEVNVVLGDQVSAGQVLARLDSADLELGLRQAEISLRQAQIQARQLEEEPGASELAAAEAALASAQAAYQQLLKGSDADQLAAARASVEQARVALEQAQQAYDKVKDVPGAGMLPQSLQLQQATINYETAQAQYRVAARAATEAQLAQARAQIAQAQANLDRLKKGATEEQKALAQAAIDQAQLAVEQAQRRLDNARLIAPWAGIVTAVNAVEGTLAQPGVPAFQLTDASRFHIEVQVDELDIASIAEGQPVTIEVDALSDQSLTGRVAKIAPTARTTSTSGTTYSVRVDIDPTDAPLRAGMSATATIVSNVREDVLLVPNRAVQRDRDTGQTFVERITPEGLQKVEVRLGLRDEQRSEVRAGLEEGDVLAIRRVSSLQRLQQTFSGFGQ